MNQYPLISLTLFILMFRGLPLSLVLMGLDILLSLLMITFAIARFFNMKHRSELLQVYSNFAKMVET